MSLLDPNADARRALGVRSGTIPIPKISFQDDGYQPRSISPGEPPSPLRQPSPTSQSPSAYPQPSTSFREISLSPSASHDVSFASPSSPLGSSPRNASGSRRFRRPTITRPKQAVPPPPSRGLYETQKLLAHLIERLETRHAAPDLLERAAISARKATGKAKGKEKSKVAVLGHAVVAATQAGLHIGTSGQGSSGSSSRIPSGGISNEDLEEHLSLEEGEWDTEATFDLVQQMLELLALAEKQHFDLFAANSHPAVPMLNPEPKRKPGRFASMASPVTTSKGMFASPNSPSELQRNTFNAMGLSGPDLLERLLEVLRTLIEVDCLHRILHFRPFAPPHALASACLDIAAYLLHKGALNTQIDVMEIIVDGFACMGELAVENVCGWIEGRLSELLHRLARARGGPHADEETNFADPFAPNMPPRKSIPTVAITEDPDEESDQAHTPGWIRYSPVSPTNPFFPPLQQIAGMLSTHTATSDLGPSLLRIASLVTRTLYAVASAVDLSTTKLSTIHRVHRLLSLCLVAKPDAYLDLLEIVAEADPHARRSAVEILTTFFPGDMGHNIIARRPALSTYHKQRMKWETGLDSFLAEDDLESHHYVPWRVSSKDGSAEGKVRCTGCASDIHGFGLRCTLCNTFTHLHCYMPSHETFTYDLTRRGSRRGSSQTITIKFSKCLPTLSDNLLPGSTRDPNASYRSIGQHQFCRVNMFHLTLCESCRQPLWGSSGQAFACLYGCQRFYHPACLDNIPATSVCRHGQDVLLDDKDSIGHNPFAIALDGFRRSFDEQVGPLCLDEDALGKRTYDEVAVLFGALWTQQQLLKNGRSSGSLIVVGHESKDSDIFGIRATLRTYEEYLKAHAEDASTAALNFAHIADLDHPLGTGYLFSPRFLGYCTALIRSPTSQGMEPSTSEGLLTASGLPAIPSQMGGDGSAYEMLQLSSVQQSLATDLNIMDERISRLVTDHLACSGYTSSAAFGENANKSKCWVSFGLPRLMDSSSTVELLILAIENMLDDLDLTMNEQALRLMSTRAFPSLLCSPYALERLGNALTKWVMSTEESLHRIVKEYASRHRRIPGLRLPSEGQTQAKGLTSVSLYQEDRLKLVMHFARPWLSALHAQDPELYAHVLYEQCKAPIEHASSGAAPSASEIAGIVLDRMSAIVDAQVIFGSLLDLLTAWLEDLGALAGQDVIYKSLPRLLRHHAGTDQDDSEIGDIWALAHHTADAGPEGLGRVCRWTRVLSFSGVEIPWTLLLELVGLQAKARCSTETRLDLCIAVNTNGANIDGPGLAEVGSELYSHLAGDIHRENANHKPSNENVSLLRQNLWLILRAYGVSLEEISHTSLGTVELVSKQPASMSKRRRGTFIQTSFKLNESIILHTVEILATERYPVEMLFDFLWLLLSHAHSIENVDGTMFSLCEKLYPVLWPTTGQNMKRRIRDRVILRLLSVNSKPLETMLTTDLEGIVSSTTRECLLTFILDLADEEVTIDNSAWRPSAVPLILILFDSLVQPTATSPETIVTLKCLLPTHLRAMSACFEEYLVQSSDENRLGLLTRLHRLRLHLPHWPIISWRVLENLIAEEVASVTQLKVGKSSQAVTALIDAQLVRSSLIGLGINMLAAGIGISSQTAQRIQQHVAALCTIPWSQPNEGVVNLVLPALRNALDSSKHLTVGVSPATRHKQGRLVGSLFVPIVIDYAKVLEGQEFMVQRYLLDILLVTFFKQDIKPVELAALDSLRKLAEFASITEYSENSIMAISIIHQAIPRLDPTGFLRATPHIFASISSLLIRETEDDGDTLLIDQCASLLRSLIKSFGKSGLFFQILKLDTQTVSLGHILPVLFEQHDSDSRVALQRCIELTLVDAGEALKRDRKTLELVMASLSRLFRDLKLDLSDNAAELLGSLLIRLSKHVAEWTPAEFDPKQMLEASAAAMRLLSYTAGQTFIHQVSTFLHLSLTRFRVDQATVDVLIDASLKLVRTDQENSIRVVMAENAAAVLRGSATTATTLHTLLQYLTTANGMDSVILDGAAGCKHILLRNHPTMAILSNATKAVDILSSAAAVLLKADASSPGYLTHALQGITTEAAGVQLTAFTYIVLASLESTGNDRSPATLGTLYPIIARAMALSLRASGDYLGVQDAVGSGAELLSSVYAMFRLLLLRGTCSGATGEEAALEGVWSRTWPDIYRLIGLSLDKTCINLPLRAIAHTTFLDLIIFLSSAQSPLLETHGGSLSHTLQLIVHFVETTDVQAPGKLIRAVECLDASQRTQVDVVDVAGSTKDLRGDLLAAERLRALRNVATI